MPKIPPGVAPRLPQIVVLFGATGDLSQRKLLPGLFHLSAAGFLPNLFIIGVSLEDFDAQAFRSLARQAIERNHNRSPSMQGWEAFEALLGYVPMSAGPGALKAAVDKAALACNGESRLVHYLSVPPSAALSAVRMLDEADLAKGSRVIMEKPFGTDLESAIALNSKLHAVFDEDQIFRIDQGHSTAGKPGKDRFCLWQEARN